MEYTYFYLPLALFLLHSIFKPGLVTSVTNLTTDESALIAFKSHILTYNPQNTLIYNWSTSVSTMCHWVGVTCGGRQGRVVALNLSNMGFGGPIPPSLGNLSFLVSLNLSYNNFHDHLPNDLRNLHRLKVIDLWFNYLSGEIPLWFSEFPKLEKLRLRNNNFTGSIPLVIYNVSSLKTLDLSYNILRGVLPYDMCIFLPKLEYLSLTSNDLYGQLPLNLDKCSQLKILSLSFNKFTERIPRNIGNLTNLKELYIGATNLEGDIPEGIVNLVDLEIFSASDVGLTGDIPKEIGNLIHLEYFIVQNNGLTGSIPCSIFNISSLRILSAYNNSFSGHLSSCVGLGVQNLEAVYLWGNYFSGVLPNFFSNASNLMILESSNNSFSGHIPAFLGNLKYLQWLNIGFNNFTTDYSNHECSFLSVLGNCKYLKALDISNNPLDCFLPTSIGNLSKSLQIMMARDAKIKGHIPMEIGNLSNAFKISLSGNELSGSIPTTIGRLKSLQGLFLDENKLQGFIPNDVCHLRKLSELSLSSNSLNGSIPTCLSNVTTLRYLYLDSNKLSSGLPSTLWSLTYLLELNVATNYLSGSLPLDVGNMKVLTILDLSWNNLSGVLPSSISDMKDVTYLSLANNKFQGKIPSSFGQLISLETLDLSVNNLSGLIPKSLEHLSHLTQFNVSFNNLEGEIPTGGRFGNFSWESYLGNYALCGASQLRVQTCKVQQPKRTSWHILKYILPAVASVVLLGVVIISKICRRRNRNVSNQESLVPLATWTRFSHLELQWATNGFSASNLLGTGAFGSVYKGSLTDGTNVAVKVFDLQHEEEFKSFDVECEILRNIRHRNLVKIISCCSELDFKALVLKFMPKESLEKWLYSYNYFLDILQRLTIMIDIGGALEYLHHDYTTQVIHCDLKPSNVLLDEDMVAHLGDFGISKLLQEGKSMTKTLTLATIGYMAPEYGSGGIISVKGDVYSFGILLMETFTRKKPTDEMFSGEMSLKQWVKGSLLSHDIVEFVDSNLLEGEARSFTAKTNCVSAILTLALECAAESPQERGSMKDVVVTLKKIEQKYVKDTKRTRTRATYAGE